MEQLKRLIREIHRRSLWQVLAIYIAASWAVLEAADVLIERLALPGWIYGLAIILLLVGLPIVLATAFVQEGVAPDRSGPEAPATGAAEAPAAEVRETGPGTGGPSRLRRLFTWRNALSGGVLALALWGVVAAGWLLFHEDRTGPPRPGKSVAVLPLAHMSADPEDRYFTDGVHDAIIEHLAKVPDLKVISRTSVMEYRNTTRNIRGIADELGVSTVLEGSVQRAGGQVRITAQLIAAESDEHLWAESYERELTARNVFEIQRDVAREIASALRATLVPGARAGDEVPTEDLEAYDYYLRGRDYFRRGFERRDLEIAVEMYGRAIELDPEFAAAQAALSIAHSALYWHGHDRTEDRLARARRAVDRAFELEPDLADAHLAMGYWHYWGHRNYEAALEELRTARDLRPGDAEVLRAIGYVLRRKGEWEEAAATQARGLELDPRVAVDANQMGTTLVRMRRYAEADRYLSRALSLAPEWPHTYRVLAIRHLMAGDREAALEILRRASTEGLANELLAHLISSYGNGLVLLRVFPAEFEEALGRLDPAVLDVDGGPFYLAKAELYAALERPTGARALYDSARSALEEEIRRSPDNSLLRGRLGLAYAGLGRAQDARVEGRAAVEQLPLSRDAYDGHDRLVTFAGILTRIGDPDAALDRLEDLLSIPGYLSVELLRLDPIWAPLRDHPRFRALLQRYE